MNKLSLDQKKHLEALAFAAVRLEILTGVPAPIPARTVLGCFLNVIVCLREKWPDVSYRENRHEVIDLFLIGKRKAERAPRR